MCYSFIHISCPESTVYAATIILTTINGNEAVFTEDGLGTPGSQEFVDHAILMKDMVCDMFFSTKI